MPPGAAGRAIRVQGPGKSPASMVMILALVLGGTRVTRTESSSSVVAALVIWTPAATGGGDLDWEWWLPLRLHQQVKCNPSYDRRMTKPVHPRNPEREEAALSVRKYLPRLRLTATIDPTFHSRRRHCRTTVHTDVEHPPVIPRNSHHITAARRPQRRLQPPIRNQAAQLHHLAASSGAGGWSSHIYRPAGQWQMRPMLFQGAAWTEHTERRMKLARACASSRADHLNAHVCSHYRLTVQHNNNNLEPTHLSDLMRDCQSRK
ncbi:uncharacterized protein B0H64DRAFT_173619 [Chaetomium fimeti]|uniref:Uncharacterized protein n=1 Tax=Chaetomium fimeti TaxID=1854472 RepID=A0AAE0HC72_9PEZI|nr:hypothetical protein B0H64DRAFT_173619 [Chaetomium fimeti]